MRKPVELTRAYATGAMTPILSELVDGPAAANEPRRLCTDDKLSQRAETSAISLWLVAAGQMQRYYTYTYVG